LKVESLDLIAQVLERTRLNRWNALKKSEEGMRVGYTVLLKLKCQTQIFPPQLINYWMNFVEIIKNEHPVRNFKSDQINRILYTRRFNKL